MQSAKSVILLNRHRDIVLQYLDMQTRHAELVIAILEMFSFPPLQSCAGPGHVRRVLGATTATFFGHAIAQGGG